MQEVMQWDPFKLVFVDNTIENARRIKQRREMTPEELAIDMEAERRAEAQSFGQNFISGGEGIVQQVHQGLQGWRGQPIPLLEYKERQINERIPAHSWGGMLGNMATGMLAEVPALAAQRVLGSGASALGSLARNVPVLGTTARVIGSTLNSPLALNMIPGAVTEAVKHPEAPLPAAGMAAAIGGGTTLAARALGGFRDISPGAQAIYAKVPDAELTLGQHTGKPSVQIWEQRREALPFSGEKFIANQERGIEDYNLAMLRSVAVKPEDIIEPGAEGVRRMSTQFNLAFRDINRQLPVDTINIDNALTNSLAIVDNFRPGMMTESEKAIDNMLEKYIDTYTGTGIPKRRFQKIENGLWKKAEQFRKGFGTNPPDEDAALATLKIRDQFRQDWDAAAGPDLAARARELRAKKSMFYPVVDASAMAGARRNEGIFTPDQLDAAMARDAGKGQRLMIATQQVPVQKLNRPMLDAFYRYVPPRGPGTAEKLSVGNSLKALGGLVLGEALPAINAIGKGQVPYVSGPARTLYDFAGTGMGAGGLGAAGRNLIPPIVDMAGNGVGWFYDWGTGNQ